MLQPNELLELLHKVRYLIKFQSFLDNISFNCDSGVLSSILPVYKKFYFDPKFHFNIADSIKLLVVFHKLLIMSCILMQVNKVATKNYNTTVIWCKHRIVKVVYIWQAGHSQCMPCVYTRIQVRAMSCVAERADCA